jgi:hypothetical protein
VVLKDLIAEEEKRVKQVEAERNAECYEIFRELNEAGLLVWNHGDWRFEIGYPKPNEEVWRVPWICVKTGGHRLNNVYYSDKASMFRAMARDIALSKRGEFEPRVYP